MAKKRILTLGTERRSRIPNWKLPTENEMKKEKRGTSAEYVADIDGVEVSPSSWKDNKLVTFISTFAGKIPTTEAKRWNKKEKNVQAKCPYLVPEYYKHMGGVDAMDGLIGLYKIKIRSRKWYMRLFYHLLDMTIVNNWITCMLKFVGKK